MQKTTLLLLALAVPALSQTSIKEAMAKHWKASGELTLAVAEPAVASVRSPSETQIVSP